MLFGRRGRRRLGYARQECGLYAQCCAAGLENADDVRNRIPHCETLYRRRQHTGRGVLHRSDNTAYIYEGIAARGNEYIMKPFDSDIV